MNSYTLVINYIYICVFVCLQIHTLHKNYVQLYLYLQGNTNKQVNLNININININIFIDINAYFCNICTNQKL